MTEDLQRKIEQSKVKPWFADEVLISANIKARKNKKSVDKEGYVRLLFLNMVNKEPISEIVLSRFTAEKLSLALKESLGKLEKEMKKKDLPKKPIIKSTAKKKPAYMG